MERVYLGVGNTQKEAYADLLNSTGAQAASDVNCNYNSYSGKWIAFGCRRTASEKLCIKDFMLYSGDNPPNELTASGYKRAGSGSEKVNVIYKRVDRNLRSGSERISLNSGVEDAGLYLYYTEGDKKETLCYDRECEKPMTPIRNIAFGYGDASPYEASVEYVSSLYRGTHHGMESFHEDAYQFMKWEYVIGIDEDKCENGRIFDISDSVPMSLNYGQFPKKGNDRRHNSDMRVMMYVDHGGRAY